VLGDAIEDQPRPAPALKDVLASAIAPHREFLTTPGSLLPEGEADWPTALATVLSAS
jgi:hypothetical protein